jgi:hypothetical protein
MKCADTVDEFLLSLLYSQSEKLYQQLEPVVSTRGSKQPEVLRIIDGVQPS